MFHNFISEWTASECAECWFSLESTAASGAFHSSWQAIDTIAGTQQILCSVWWSRNHHQAKVFSFELNFSFDFSISFYVSILMFSLVRQIELCSRNIKLHHQQSGPSSICVCSCASQPESRLRKVRFHARIPRGKSASWLCNFGRAWVRQNPNKPIRNHFLVRFTLFAWKFPFFWLSCCKFVF